MVGKISSIIFRIIGWEFVGNIPEGVRKGVIIFAPHTSNYDFSIAYIGSRIINLRLKFLIKKEACRFGLGLIVRAIGGIPVDRNKAGNMVDQVAHILEQRDIFIVIAPEGTRKAAPVWKKGFYHIAKKADVPLIISYIDYDVKKVGILDTILLTGEMEQDWNRIRSYYKNSRPCHPERYILPEKLH